MSKLCRDMVQASVHVPIFSYALKFEVWYRVRYTAVEVREETGRNRFDSVHKEIETPRPEN